jgi:hypothetical protein
MIRHMVVDAERATHILLERLRGFCFPEGEEVARSIRVIKTRESGQLRMSADAHWVPFSAEQVIESHRSAFHWEARMNPGKLTATTVVDVYEDGHGWLSVKVGLIPVKKITGPDADRGELQRYLASVLFCPPMLLNNPSLRCNAVGPRTLQFSDSQDPTGATVDVDISEDGSPVGCRTERPRLVGKKTVLTEWVAMCSEFRLCDGLRVPTRLEVAWKPPEGAFKYFKSQLESFTVVS